MAQVKFGRKDEPGFELELGKDLLAVRTRSRDSLQSRGPVRSPLAAEVDDGVDVHARLALACLHDPGRVDREHLARRRHQLLRLFGGAELNRLGSIASSIRVEKAAENLPVPLHNGAQRFYAEAGR